MDQHAHTPARHPPPGDASHGGRTCQDGLTGGLRGLLTVTALFAIPLAADSQAAMPQAGETATVQRLIVRLRAEGSGALAAHASALSGLALIEQRRLSTGGHVLHLPVALTATAARAVAQSISQDPAVLSAEPDLLLVPQGLLFNPLAPASTPTGFQGYASQWYLGSASGNEPTAIGLAGAINASHGGSPGLTIAVLDTGILAHPDLGGANSAGTRYLPSGRFLTGFNFTGADSDYASSGCQPPGGSYVFSNTANSPQAGRAPDPTDPGNWIDAAVRATSAGCLFGSSANTGSDWHGTEMTSIIAASTDSALQFDGINQNSQILPVRVAGRGGAFLSDIIEAAYWSAGLQTAALQAQGISRNPNPAQVLNVSLGATGACSPSWQDALNAILAPNGPVKAVVVAAGNEGAAPGALASCRGAVVVGAVNRAGQRSAFSNFGSAVTLAAPGGDCSNGSASGCVVAASDAIFALGNSGTTTALGNNYTSLWNVVGTSPATGLVSGVVSLMLSANPSLSPAQVVNTLQASARPFPVGSNCSAGVCGAGMLDANAAVQLALSTPAAAAGAPSAGTPSLTGSSTPNIAASGISTGGAAVSGGGGGGGCGFSAHQPVDPLLPLLPVLFLIARPVRRRLGVLATTMAIRSSH